MAWLHYLATHRSQIPVLLPYPLLLLLPVLPIKREPAKISAEALLSWWPDPVVKLRNANERSRAGSEPAGIMEPLTRSRFSAYSTTG
jgi:hypothetical protein